MRELLSEREVVANLSDVVRRVQRIFGDDFETQIRTSDIKDWANEALVIIVRQTECLQATAQFTYGPTTDGVDLPTDFIGEKRITFDGVALDRTQIGELDDLGVDTTTAQGSMPVKYYIWGPKLYLYPRPSVAVTNGLTLWYIQHPGTQTDVNEQLPIPIDFHDDVVRMCLIRARELNEDYEQAARLQEEVNARLGMARDDQQNRVRETYPVVRDDPADIW